MLAASSFFRFDLMARGQGLPSRGRAETEHYYEQFMWNNFCVGVHRRVVNGGTTFLQASRKMPTTEEVIERAKDEIRNSGAASAVVYLATDDREAVEKFREAFGDRLVVREEVQRTTS